MDNIGTNARLKHSDGPLFENMQIIKAGWEKFRVIWKNFLVALLAYIVAYLPLAIIDMFWGLRLYDLQWFLPEESRGEIEKWLGGAGANNTVWYHLYSVFAFIWTLIISYNWYRSFYPIYDERVYAFSEMFKIPDSENFRNFVNYWLASFFYGFMVFLGLVLFIVPGIYVAIRYGQVFNLILDKKFGVEDAFVTSSKMTLGIKWKILGLVLVQLLISLGILLIGIVVLFIGIIPAIFIASGWSLMTMVHLYRYLYTHKIEPINPIHT